MSWSDDVEREVAAVLDRPMMQSDVVKIVNQRFPVRTGCRVPQSRFGIEGLMEAMPVPHSIASRPPGIGAAHGELDYTHGQVVLIPIVVVPVGCAHPLSQWNVLTWHRQVGASDATKHLLSIAVQDFAKARTRTGRALFFAAITFNGDDPIVPAMWSVKVHAFERLQHEIENMDC